MKRIAVVALVVGLLGCRADQLLPPRPSALIQDAGHNGGNQFFAFLQPMVSHPTTNGVFDPNLSPVVRVDLLSGACTNVSIIYTMRAGPGTDASETIRVNPTDHNYIVNLHTDKVPVSSGCTYRIYVGVGSTELGFADVALFLTQKEAKNLTTDETVALVDGKTLPIKFWIAGGALCGAGADCGQGTAYPDRDNVIVTENLQAGVSIPAGAVDAPTTIIIESVNNRPCFPGLLGQTFQGVPGSTANSCYEFRTDPPLPGGSFTTNVTVGICVDLTAISSTQEPEVQILQFDDGEVPTIRALPNAPAPFLPCDPGYQTPIGLGKRNLLDLAARAFRSLLSPQPLYARSRALVFNLGAGGSTCCFSLFTWGLVTNMEKNDGDGQTAAVGSAVATAPSVIFRDSTGALVDSVPVTFSVGSGGGTITGESTKSGRGGVPGVARVGSWTLGSAGTNMLIASAPEFSTVTPTSVTFTATGTSATVGLLLQYRFEGNVDNTGALSGYNGTATSVTYPEGRFGSAIKFDGTSATGATLTGTSSVFGMGSKWTISLWFREDVKNAETLLWRFRGSIQGWETYHGVTEPGQRMITCSDGGCLSFISDPGLWHSLIYRYDGVSNTVGAPVAIYVDGVLAGQIDNTAAIPLVGSGVTDIRLGNLTGILGPSVFYIDEFRVYNQVFSIAQQCTDIIGGSWSGTACTLP